MRNERPVLKQFGCLVLADFDAAPVWASCHSFDHDESWIDDTDEETFRPWKGRLPADPSEGTFLVRASFRAASGREFPGLVTPASFDAGHDVGLMQPYLDTAGRFFGFWGGVVGVDAAEKSAFYSVLGARPEELFPINFSYSPQLASGRCSGSIAGFYRSLGAGKYVVDV